MEAKGCFWSVELKTLSQTARAGSGSNSHSIQFNSNQKLNFKISFIFFKKKRLKPDRKTAWFNFSFGQILGSGPDLGWVKLKL